MSAPTVERSLSATDAEKLLGISASTVRTWYQRRARTHLHPVDTDRRGRPKFRESDLVQLRDGRRQISAVPSPRHGELGRLLAAWEAEKHLGIPASTVSTWHHRESVTRLHSVGRDGSGRPLFYEAELIALRRGLRLRDDDGKRIQTMLDLA
ncbi:MAG TPA: hypothetical protein VIQ30_02135 [Pseudonocardia sp.]